LITICACNASYIQTSNDLIITTKPVGEKEREGGGRKQEPIITFTTGWLTFATIHFVCCT